MVVIHHLGQQGLIERSPVHADPNRLSVLQRDLDDRAEVLVGALAAHVTGIDAVLREGLGAGGVLGEKQVAVVVKIPNDRDRDADPVQASTIAGTAAAASSLFTVTRTSSLPALARAATCAIVPSTSAVSVLVMDWTTTG
jgi:hypothetical protein